MMAPSSTRTPASERIEKLSRQAEEIARLATTPKLRQEARSALRAIEWEKIKLDPWYFISNFCYTKDEHDKDDPYKQVPDKEYLRIFCALWVIHPRINVPKSRQIMMSWICALLNLWLAVTHKGQLIFFQSKKEEDADKLVQRAHGVWKRLPNWIKKRAPAKYSYCNLKFTTRDCLIQGIPQGQDQIRSNTASSIVCDEAAFQPEFGGAFTAAQPAIDGGGRMTNISSAKQSTFFDMLDSPEIPGSRKVLIDAGWVEEWSPKVGMVSWVNEMDWLCVEISYKADPVHTKAWALGASKKYIGGLLGPNWQGEMEIDPGAKAGKRVFPMFTRENHVVPAFKVPSHWPRWRGIDSGYNNPCAVVWVAQDRDGCFYVYDLVYERGKDVPAICEMIKPKTGKQKFEFTMIGHDAYASTQAARGKTIADQYAEQGIFCSPSYVKSEDFVPLMADLLRVRDNGEPMFKVLGKPQLEPMISEFEKYRYPEQSEQQALTANQKEQPLKKDDHSIEATKHIVCAVSPDYQKEHGLVDDDPVETWTTKTSAARMRVRTQTHNAPDTAFWDD